MNDGEQPHQPGLLTYEGEPMKAPHEAQEFDVSIKQPRQQLADSLGMQSLGQALRKIPLSLGRVSAAVVEPLDPELARREHLLYLQRWTGPTEHCQQMLDRTIARIAELGDQKKTP